jgi:simple sugar transport system substrate-binding protein
MKRTLLWVGVLLLSILIVVTFSLAGCKTTAAAESTAAAGVTAANDTATVTGKHFAGISIYFFPGGSEGGPFESVVYKGAKAAEEDLGPKVTYVWSGWNPEKMIAQFKEAIAAKPDGIAIMGHPGEVAFAPLVDEAESKGIIVTSQNTDLPGIEAKYIAKGFGYAGQGLYSSGIALAKKSIEKWGLKKGDKALVWGLLSQETRGLRTKGCIDALEEAGLKVDYLEISNEINADSTLGTPVLTGYISANPDVKLVITDHGNLTSTVGTFMKASKKEPGDIKCAGFDLSSASVDAIKSGYLGLVLDQQPYLQGYLPILQICLSKMYNFSGLHIDTGSGFVDETNVDVLASLAEKGIR